MDSVRLREFGGALVCLAASGATRALRAAGCRLREPAMMHLGIWLTLRLDYSAWALTALALFVPWELVAVRKREPAINARGAPVGSPPGPAWFRSR